MKEEIKRYALTYILITLNVLVYLVCTVSSESFIDIPLETLVNFGALYGSYTVGQQEWYRLFSAMFLHGGMTHLLMNMVSLYIVGRAAENYFDGRAYLVIYLFSGLIGALASLYMHPQSVGVGASGAIFGVFGALAGFFLAHRDKIASQSKAFLKDFGVIIGLNLVIGLFIPAIDVSAHIAGLAVGMMGGFVLSKKPQWVWIIAVVMVGLMIWMSRILSDEYVTALF
jgi:rhomboid protease GluP